MTENRKRSKKLSKVLAYYRTSSAANVGGDRDSLKRQAAAVEGFAKRSGYQVVETFYDAAVSGVDAIEERPGFADLLDRIEANGVRTVIVEDVSRFARDNYAHVVGLALLRERGVTLLTADGHNLTDDTDEMQEAMLSVMAVFAMMEKKRLVKKLKAARDRKSAKQGKRIEGRKGYQVTNPELVKAAKSLAHGNRKGEREDGGVQDTALRQRLGIGRKRLSLRAISIILAEKGYTTSTGKPFSPEQVKRLLTA